MHYIKNTLTSLLSKDRLLIYERPYITEIFHSSLFLTLVSETAIREIFSFLTRFHKMIRYKKAI